MTPSESTFNLLQDDDMDNTEENLCKITDHNQLSFWFILNIDQWK